MVRSWALGLPSALPIFKEFPILDATSGCNLCKRMLPYSRRAPAADVALLLLLLLLLLHPADTVHADAIGHYSEVFWKLVHLLNLKKVWVLRSPALMGKLMGWQ